MTFRFPTNSELDSLVEMLTSHGPQWMALALIGCGDIAYRETNDATAAHVLFAAVYNALQERLPQPHLMAIDEALDDLLDERQPIWCLDD